jgi:imidazolonepropionase-like amidohydrolase
MKRIAVFAMCVCAWAQPATVIRNVTIHPVAGPDIPLGAIVIANGRIADVGARVTVPRGARVIEGKGLHAYPGMIDSATQIGLSEIGSIRETNDTNEIGDFNPQIRAIVAVNPESEHIPVTRANGITTVLTLPSTGAPGGRAAGGSSMIAGQAALIRLDGWTWEDLAVRPAAALQLVFPTIQMGGGLRGQGAGGRNTFSEARTAYEKRLRELGDFFEEARRYQKAKAGAASGVKTDLRLEAMLPVIEGKVPVFVNAIRERTIRDALQFADRQKIKIVLAGPRDFGGTMAEIKARGIPVIAPPTQELPLEEDDGYDLPFTLPAELHRAGIKFAFGSFNVQFARNLPYQAATAVAFGLPYEEALKAVTLNAAEIWGVAADLGSIEKGKLADLILTDGDPLEIRTQIKHMFVRGIPVDLSNRHNRLYEKYMARP